LRHCLVSTPLPRTDIRHHADRRRIVEQSAAIRARIERARKLQHARFHDSKFACNADMGPAEVRRSYELDEVSCSLLRSVGTRPPAVPTTVQRT
jgi:magnesium chelatase family protein